jgi:hypothetical protein
VFIELSSPSAGTADVGFESDRQTFALVATLLIDPL